MNELQRHHDRDLFTKFTKPLNEHNDPNQHAVDPTLNGRPVFRWRDYDKTVLDQIRASATAACDEVFNGLLNTADELYRSFRKPAVNEHGVTRINASGRIVWEVDERGNFIDEYDNLTGQDIEQAIMLLQRDKIDAHRQVNELFLDAVFAKHLYDDEYHERYEALIEGTISDRNARANRDTKQGKYHAFFRFYMYQQAEVMFREIENLQRLLERIRQWRVSDQYEERRR